MLYTLLQFKTMCSILLFLLRHTDTECKVLEGHCLPADRTRQSRASPERIRALGQRDKQMN